MMRRQRLAAVLLACGVLAVRGGATEPAPGGWRLEREDPQRPASLTLTLRAQQDVKGWLNASRPVLTIRCSDRKAAVYVETGVALEVTQVDQQIVRVRFDDSEFHPERWREIGNWTISSRHPDRLIEQLVRSRRLMLEFTPFGSAPAQAEFALQGLAEYSRQLAISCSAHESAGSDSSKDAR